MTNIKTMIRDIWSYKIGVRLEELMIDKLNDSPDATYEILAYRFLWDFEGRCSVVQASKKITDVRF